MYGISIGQMSESVLCIILIIIFMFGGFVIPDKGLFNKNLVLEHSTNKVRKQEKKKMSCSSDFYFSDDAVIGSFFGMTSWESGVSILCPSFPNIP